MKGLHKKNSKEAIISRTNPLYRHGRHCVFLVHIHLVFVTKYRRFCFSKRVLDHLKIIMHSVCTQFEAELVEFNGEGDHVHLLINYPPKVSISKLVNSLKGVSSRHIRKANYPEVTKKLWGSKLWSTSYFAGSCGGANLDVVKKYIDSQNSPD
jgi:putative transposase